jgi:hypothetical protein
MNNTFSIKRFGLLLKRQWLEFGKIYLILLAVALGIIVISYGLALSKHLFSPIEPFSSNDLFFREPLFSIFGFLFITVIASSYFAHLGQKPKAIIDLLIPASSFEKFIAGVFFTAVLSTASYLVLFYLTDLAFLAKLRSIHSSMATVSTYTDANGANVGTVDNMAYFFQKHFPDIIAPLYIVPFFITSIFLLGSVYFNRFHYIKTAISVMIFSGIWTYLIYKSGRILMDGRIPVQTDQYRFVGQKDHVELYMTLLLLVLTFVFWAITYVRLKEKEV